MTNSRDKGARGEREAAKLLTDLLGYPLNRTRTPGESADVGDLWGLPNTVVEVKARASIADSIRIGLPQVEAARERAGVDFGVVLVKRPRAGFVVVQDVENWCGLWREATA